MGRGFAMAGAAAAVCSVLVIGASAATGAEPVTTWGTAEAISGLAALNQGGNAQVTSVSCGSAGNCSAGGFYTDGLGDSQPFVVTETNGTWGTAQEVPGTTGANVGGGARVTSVSCSSAGTCAAGGWYQVASQGGQALVVGQTNGTWGTATQVPGLAALNVDDSAGVTSVSCRSAGNCSAGGFYTDGTGHSQAFVARETSGTWRTAQEVPGTAALNTGGNAEVTSVSCSSAGNCGAAGWYQVPGHHADGSGYRQAFVVGETNGTWGTAQEVPGTAALNTGEYAQVASVSCRSAGNCSAGGQYLDGAGHSQVFVASETSGTWGMAQEVPGSAALNKRGMAQIMSVSCGSAGNCSAGGQYLDGSGHFQAFIVGQVNGTWGSAKKVPGTATLNAGGSANLISVSCATAGNCTAGGDYADGSGQTQAFVVAETNGTWRTAQEVPGTAALNASGAAEITSVACASAGHCSAGGNYSDSSFSTQAFVVGET